MLVSALFGAIGGILIGVGIVGLIEAYHRFKQPNA